MNKGLIFLLGIISFLGINTVSAKTDVIDLYFSQSDDFTANLLNNEQTISILENKFYDVIDEILTEHDDYYYIMGLGLSGNLEPYFVVYSFKTSFTDYSALISHCNNNDITTTYYFLQPDNFSYRIATEYYPLTFGRSSPFPFDMVNFEYYPSNFYLSNMEIPYNSSNVANIYMNDELFFTLNNGDFIPNYKDIINPTINTYTSINLNEYSYVALSLKDYNNIPPNNSTVYTNLYVKGQLCITPVYNYGQTERKDILTGTQVQGCSQYYNDFTLTRMYILKDDVKNHAIYYLKAYDTSKENIVKIDSTKFNISYISEEKKDNPEVLINGKLYPTLSYGSLTDTSTKSEEEGYLPGVSCALGDFNCYTENNADNMFNDLFDKPLDTLKSVWNSISSIFDLISEFISLLPDTMQTFLYISFMLAIILGLLKIIL